MLFVPDYKLEILTESQFPEAISNIENTLAQYKKSGRFKTFDGLNIHYEYFMTQSSQASVVIVHGLSEFCKKFYELIYCLLNQGYNVFIYDQRCHGFSGRLTDKIDLLHVDSFEDYVKDLEQFIDEIVIPSTDKPIYLYSHSMGGAVCTLYLAKHSDKIKKAVLSAPMFEPVVNNVTTSIARWGVWIGKLLYGAKKKFILSNEFDPDIMYEESYGTSKARFEHNMKIRKENIHFQSTPMTFGWVYNSLTVRSKILNRKTTAAIKTPILLLSPENDMTVKEQPQILFSKKCSTCRLVKIKNANHSLLASDSKTINELLNLTLDFFA